MVKRVIKPTPSLATWTLTLEPYPPTRTHTCTRTHTHAQIGEGAHGTVYLAVKEGEGAASYAIKRIARRQGPLSSARRERQGESPGSSTPSLGIPEEISILRTLRHENVGVCHWWL